MTLILLTNDDGIEAEGIRVLENCLEGLAEIVVVAPDRERSAVSHGLTLRSPLELKEIRPRHYTLSGTPADCVIYSMSNVLSSEPDLVISGINHGANLADDIMYSGTVAAAREASHRGIAGIAVSQAYDEKPIQFDKGARFIKGLVRTMIERGFERGFCLNINIPVRRIKGVKITRQGCAPRFPHFNSLQFAGSAESGDSDSQEDMKKPHIMSDYHAIMNQFISITPLQRDQTDYRIAETLLKDPPRLFRRFRLPRIGLIG